MELFYPDIKWNLVQKIAFRFFSLFILLFIFPFPINLLGFTEIISEWYYNFLDSLVPAVGNSMLGIHRTISLEENGSGDKTKDYVKLFIFFLIAFVFTFIWSLFDRKRKSYDTLFHYFLIVCRYYLAFTLMGYGFQKVYKLQMSEVGLNQLLMPVGDQTPMGLAWKFIGFSDLYCCFSGWAEVVPGILLLFRRTTLLGAVISFVVMFNVMMMNYAYDIPVKIYSSFLVLLSIIVIIPYFNKLLGIFLLSKKSTEGTLLKPLFTQKWKRITALILKCAVILLFVFINFYGALDATSYYGEKAPKPPMYGIYQTQTFVKNNDTIRLYTDSTAWRHLVFSWPDMASVFRFSGKRYNTTLKIDTLKHEFNMKFMYDTNLVYHVNYLKINDSIFTFRAISSKDTLDITSKKIKRSNFLLYKTGFNWINEKPNNK